MKQIKKNINLLLTELNIYIFSSTIKDIPTNKKNLIYSNLDSGISNLLRDLKKGPFNNEPDLVLQLQKIFKLLKNLLSLELISEKEFFQKNVILLDYIYYFTNTTDLSKLLQYEINQLSLIFKEIVNTIKNKK